MLNVALNASNAQVTALPYSTGGASVGPIRVVCDGTHDLNLTAIANATASVVYGAVLTATLITSS